MSFKKLFEGEEPLNLSLIGFPNTLKILVLAPHPDDFDAIGVTLRYFKENANPIFVAVVSSSASGVEDEFCTPCSPEEKAKIREQEQRESCKYFGLPESHLTFLRLAEDISGQPTDDNDNQRLINEYCHQIHPDFVFLPHGNDANTGHQRTYSMFRRFAIEAGYPIVAFLNRDPKTISMREDAFFPFGPKEEMWKRELLLFHRSQHQRNLNTRNYGFDERILRVNSQAAKRLSISKSYAETFQLELFE